jgi:hypothetical protein
LFIADDPCLIVFEVAGVSAESNSVVRPAKVYAVRIIAAAFAKTLGMVR